MNLWLKKAEDRKIRISRGDFSCEEEEQAFLFFFFFPGSDHVSTMNAVLPKLLYIKVHTACEFRAHAEATAEPPAKSTIAEQ